MSVPRNRWYNCISIVSVCPIPAIPVPFNKNPSLFSGSTNNPGSLATDIRRYANKVNSSNFGHKRQTVILPVVQRVVAPLSNRIP